MSDENKSFEQALARLDEIVTKLEDTKTPLDKLLELFEEGIGNLRFCGAALENAEKRVVSLTKNRESGEIEEVDFLEKE